MRGDLVPKAFYGHYPLTGVTKNDPYEIDDTEIWEKLNDHSYRIFQGGMGA